MQKDLRTIPNANKLALASTFTFYMKSASWQGQVEGCVEETLASAARLKWREDAAPQRVGGAPRTPNGRSQPRRQLELVEVQMEAALEEVRCLWDQSAQSHDKSRILMESGDR